jgi:hypothetical protein
MAKQVTCRFPPAETSRPNGLRSVTGIGGPRLPAAPREAYENAGWDGDLCPLGQFWGAPATRMR